MVAITGIAAWSDASRKGQTGWPLAFIAVTVLGVAGPIIALIWFRDTPDRLVPVATVLLALSPATALVYPLMPKHR